MLTYADLDPQKKGFIFELDDVLYPKKDYLLQVYYLFANFIEFTETVPLAQELTYFFKNAYEHHGSDQLFDRAQEAFGIDEKYRTNFQKLHYTARLPLKLLLYKQVMDLLQQIVIDRKQLFVVTNGDPAEQLNKITQTEWNGLEKYLTVYFAEEILPKPDTRILEGILDKHQLLRKDVLIIGTTQIDEEFASSGGIDYLPVTDFL